MKLHEIKLLENEILIEQFDLLLESELEKILNEGFNILTVIQSVVNTVNNAQNWTEDQAKRAWSNTRRKLNARLTNPQVKTKVNALLDKVEQNWDNINNTLNAIGVISLLFFVSGAMSAESLTTFVNAIDLMDAFEVITNAIGIKSLVDFLKNWFRRWQKYRKAPELDLDTINAMKAVRKRTAVPA